MRYFKDVRDGVIVAIGTGGGGVEITGSEYDAIFATIQGKPARDGATDYRLLDEGLTWEEFERSDSTDEPEASPEELLEILLGGVDD